LEALDALSDALGSVLEALEVLPGALVALLGMLLLEPDVELGALVMFLLDMPELELLVPSLAMLIVPELLVEPLAMDCVLGVTVPYEDEVALAPCVAEGLLP
jgi:hypothetical protein